MAHKAVRLEPEEFLDHFFRSSSGPLSEEESRPRWDYNVFKCVEDTEKMSEAEIAEHFINTVNNLNLAPGLKLSESQNNPDVGDVSGQKIDAAFFRNDRVPSDHRPNWAEQLVSVEFKRYKTKCDPFDDRTEDKISADAVARKEVRGQIIDYAEQVFRYQHRTALYMLLIIGRQFRFLRWDRSGTLVTRAVDYVERPDLLCEMLWYMSRLTDEQLGVDPSAVRLRHGDTEYMRMDELGLPNSQDVDHMEGSIDELPRENQVYRYIRDAFRGSLVPNWPRYRLDVPDGQNTRRFLVGKPVFHASGMAGRGTRGYVAFDCQGGRFVWLKDAWRAHYELVDQEGSVLEKLNKEGVRNVPTLVCHGDILEQVTLTPKYWELKNPPATAPPSPPILPIPFPSSPTPTPINPIASSSRTLVEQQQPSSRGTKRSRSAVDDDDDDDTSHSPEECPLRRHKHYRLVVEEVAMNLSSFQYGRQLARVIYDCIKAHQDAQTKAQMMHRDISGGNILIFPRALRESQDGTKWIKWTGLLADWELSKPVCEAATLPRARQPERTGTWQFMSVAALSDHSKVIETPDELESFFHVLLYNAVRYLKSNCVNVGSFIEDFFDSYSLSRSDRYSCGAVKSTAMKRTGELVASNNALLFDSPLDLFFDQVLQWFKAHYAVQTYQAYQAAHKPRPSVTENKAAGPPSKSSTNVGSLGFNIGDDDDALVALPQPRAVEGTIIPRKPSPEEEEDALKVQTHSHFLGALVSAVRCDAWDVEDRVKGDNVPAKFVPKCEVGPPRGASLATLKRRREDDGHRQIGGATFPFQLPSGETPTTPSQGNAFKDRITRP